MEGELYVFVIVGSCGIHSDYNSWPACVLLVDLDRAEAQAARMNAWVKEENRKASACEDLEEAREAADLEPYSGWPWLTDNLPPGDGTGKGYIEYADADTVEYEVQRVPVV